MDQTQLLNKLIETFERWNEDLKEARKDYKDSADKLDTAREAFEENINKESGWKRLLTILPQVIITLFLIAVILLAITSLVTGKCNTLSAGEYKFSVLCELRK